MHLWTSLGNTSAAAAAAADVVSFTNPLASGSEAGNLSSADADAAAAVAATHQTIW